MSRTKYYPGLLLGCLAFSSACSGGATQDAAGLPGNRDAGNTPADSGSSNPSPRDSGATPVRMNCDDNPKRCQPHQLKDVPPFCNCLEACESGWDWAGLYCVMSTPDAGQNPPAPDAASPQGQDAAATDLGSASHDAAADAALPHPDAAASDGGPHPDAAADSGVRADGGPFMGDAGSVADAAPGIGITEGNPCNASANNCENGDVCQLTGSAGTTGICLRACNMTRNGPGLHNPACTGVGKDCTDEFGFGPSNGRCLNVFGAYQDPGSTPLATCDPSVQNLAGITGPNPMQSGICFPLCTVTPSPTNPVNLTCSGTYNFCNANGPTFADTDNNVYAACTIQVQRGAVCGEEKGRICPDGTDVCAEGLCRQNMGTTCTATSACAVAGESCIETVEEPLLATRAFCAPTCSALATGQCGANQACVEIDDPLGLPVDICRARTGTIAGGPCNDSLNQGGAASVCGEGYECLPDVSAYRLQCFVLSPVPPGCADNTANNNWTDTAVCRKLCDLGTPQCPTGTSCMALPNSLTTGVCR